MRGVAAVQRSLRQDHALELPAGHIRVRVMIADDIDLLHRRDVLRVDLRDPDTASEPPPNRGSWAARSQTGVLSGSGAPRVPGRDRCAEMSWRRAGDGSTKSASCSSRPAGCAYHATTNALATPPEVGLYRTPSRPVFRGGRGGRTHRVEPRPAFSDRRPGLRTTGTLLRLTGPSTHIDPSRPRRRQQSAGWTSKKPDRKTQIQSEVEALDAACPVGFNAVAGGEILRIITRKDPAVVEVQAEVQRELGD